MKNGSAKGEGATFDDLLVKALVGGAVYLEQVGEDFNSSHHNHLINLNGQLFSTFEVNFNCHNPMAIDINTLLQDSYSLRIDCDQGAKAVKFRVKG